MCTFLSISYYAIQPLNVVMLCMICSNHNRTISLRTNSVEIMSKPIVESCFVPTSHQWTIVEINTWDDIMDIKVNIWNSEVEENLHQINIWESEVETNWLLNSKCIVKHGAYHHVLLNLLDHDTYCKLVLCIHSSPLFHLVKSNLHALILYHMGLEGVSANSRPLAYTDH